MVFQVSKVMASPPPHPSPHFFCNFKQDPFLVIHSFGSMALMALKTTFGGSKECQNLVETTEFRANDRKSQKLN